jgi:hypothetical protein
MTSGPDDGTGERELVARMRAAVDAIREPVLRLLEEGEVHPSACALPGGGPPRSPRVPAGTLPDPAW